jgi:hypothetical protein
MKSVTRKAVFSIGATGAFLCALSAGCAGDKPGPHVAPQAAKSAPTRKAENATAATEVHRSVFTLDGSSRDPFFPHARKPAEPAAGVAVAAVQQTPMDINALLTAGLQGIGGTTDRHIAIIYNVLLEPGKRTEIPIRVNNQQRRLSVKCREITKNTVALDVEGYGLVAIKAKSTL